MTKHTPGPWIHDGIRLGDGYESAYVKTDREYPNELLICKLATFPPDNGEMDLGEDITMANARLIAAAPELLAVLVQAVQASGHPLSGPTDSRAAEHGEPKWVCNARAVIARATKGGAE